MCEVAYILLTKSVNYSVSENEAGEWVFVLAGY